MEVTTALGCLAALEDKWPGAKKCRELLEELVDATVKDMRVQISSFSPTPSSESKIVPGVGRKGAVDGKVAATPAGVEKVQTVYSSFKRTANHAEHDGPEEDLKEGILLSGNPLDAESGIGGGRKVKSISNRRASSMTRGGTASRPAPSTPPTQGGGSSSARTGRSPTTTHPEMDYLIFGEFPPIL